LEPDFLDPAFPSGRKRRWNNLSAAPPPLALSQTVEDTPLSAIEEPSGYGARHDVATGGGWAETTVRILEELSEWP
jgi:hypothetical protein